MAGPTPVSALIHAATMVAAGVYLVGRLFIVFLDADPIVLQIVAIVAGITMLGAALMAFTQDDIKRVLAYSTISQLAYMIAGMSMGPAGRTGAFFHLFTHAFFKARLFLGSGAVIDAVHSNNMSEMGGLRRHLPITFWTFLIGSLALSGVPPLAGFWSKAELLVVAEHEGPPVLFVVFLITAVITAFYTMRMVLLTFFGEYKGHAHPHESPATMTGPLVALAAATIGVGLLGSPQLGAVFGQCVFYEEVHEAVFVPWIALLSTAGALLGLLAGYALYKERREQDPLQASMGSFWNVLQNRYYIDAFYMRAIVYPVRDTWSSAVNWFNQVVIDGIVNGAATLARGLGQVVAWFDRTVIDGIVNGAGETAGRTGNVLKHLQTGNVQWYAVGLFVGVIALAVVFVELV
jgi:NADH-quinone oxidoreductase subunit L